MKSELQKMLAGESSEHRAWASACSNFNCIALDVCSVRIGSFTVFGPAMQI